MPAFSSTADAENPAPAWTVGLATFALWILFLQFTDEWPFHGFYLQTGLMLVAVMLISRLPGSAAALRPFLVFISVLVCLGTIQWVIMKGGVFSPPGLLVDGLTLPQLFIQVPVKYALFAISLLGMSHLYENMVGDKRHKLAIECFLVVCAAVSAVNLATQDRGNQLVFLGGYNSANMWFVLFILYYLGEVITGSASRKRMISVIAMIAVYGCLIGATQSREGVIALAVALGMGGIRNFRRLGKRAVPLSIAALIAIGTGIAITGPRWVAEFSSVNSFDVDSQGSSSVERIWYLLDWYLRLDFWNGLFGQGYDHCAPALFPTAELSCIRSLHNGWIQLLAHGGVVLLGSVVGLMVIFYRRHLKNRAFGIEFISIYAVTALAADHIMSAQMWLFLPACALLLHKRDALPPQPNTLPR